MKPFPLHNSGSALSVFNQISAYFSISVLMLLICVRCTLNHIIGLYIRFPMFLKSQAFFVCFLILTYWPTLIAECKLVDPELRACFIIYLFIQETCWSSSCTKLKKKEQKTLH